MVWGRWQCFNVCPMLIFILWTGLLKKDWTISTCPTLWILLPYFMLQTNKQTKPPLSHTNLITANCIALFSSYFAIKLCLVFSISKPTSRFLPFQKFLCLVFWKCRWCLVVKRDRWENQEVFCYTVLTFLIYSAISEHRGCWEKNQLFQTVNLSIWHP